MSIDRFKQINDVICPLCGHSLATHLVMPYTHNFKNITNFKIECKQASHHDFNEECKCNAGFKEVDVTVTVETRVRDE